LGIAHADVLTPWFYVCFNLEAAPADSPVRPFAPAPWKFGQVAGCNTRGGLRGKLGHNSKAVHRVYAKGALMEILSLEEFDKASPSSQIGDRDVGGRSSSCHAFLVSGFEGGKEFSHN
jgi:hypothetical protein